MSEDPESLSRARLERQALVVGYAMSRLDRAYLSARGLTNWRRAYAEAANALHVKSSSVRLLRDEFDPVHTNPRRGWLQRSLRPSRQRILDELQDMGSDALLELVDRILLRDDESVREAIDSLAVRTRIAYGVAERLLTGRRAEEYFLAHSAELISVGRNDIVDVRNAAVGFDFRVRGLQSVAIEVKGLKAMRGDVQFTDREWTEARYRAADYWLVVIGNLASHPVARVLRDPCAALAARCSYQRAIRPVWHAPVSV